MTEPSLRDARTRCVRKILSLVTLSLVLALPAAAQSSQFGILFGGSSRSTDNSPVDGPNLEDNFSLSNSSFELYYARELDRGTWFRIKAGRMELPVGLVRGTITDDEGEHDIRYDVEGEVQHVDLVVDYRFDEPYGTTGLFAGVSYFRQEGERDAVIPDDFDTSSDAIGFSVGVNGDFPLSKRYGIIIEASQHWTKLPFEPRFMTVEAGLRMSF